MESLHGKSALVTGGARRIGREIALALARAGADVAITYRNSQADAEKTAQAVQSLGTASLAVSCNVRSESSVDAALNQVVARFGRLDVLVNNAAVFQSAPLEQISLEAWDEVFSTNARGPFLVARQAVAAPAPGPGQDREHRLTRRHPRLGRPRSLLRLQGRFAHAHPGHGQAFAPEVTVNCVAPGWIEIDRELEDASARFAARTPLRRNG